VFGVIEGTRALYCGEHASDDHVDVRHKKCGEYEGSIVPSFCTLISRYCNWAFAHSYRDISILHRAFALVNEAVLHLEHSIDITLLDQATHHIAVISAP
jgi:hypothetical protein